MKKTLFFLILISFNFAFCQTQLKLEDIMKGEEFIGFQPENATWSLDNETIYFEWNPNKEIGKSTYFWKKGMKEPQKATPEEAAFYGNNFITNDYKTYYYIQNGGLYSYQPLTKIKKRIFQNSNYISNLSLGKNEGIIFIEQAGNIIKINSKTGSFEQITNFSKNKPREEIKKEKSFLSDQQEELFQFIKDSEKRKEWYNAKNKLIKKNFPKSFGTGKNIQNLSPNPNEKFVTFTEGTEPDAKSEIMERWITNDGYNQSENSKDKVSLKNLYPIRFGIYNTEKDSAYFVKGQRLYEWTQTNLQDSTDYLYFDNINLNGKVDKAKFAYNSGQMMQSASLLYQFTGQEKYLTDAQNIAKGCHNYFFQDYTPENGEPFKLLKKGDVWFIAVMLRGFIELYQADKNETYLDSFSKSLDYAWGHARDEKGLFNTDFSGKTQDNRRWLLTQAAMVEMYARLAAIK